MKLISMVEYVLEQRNIQIRPSEVCRLSVNYANFLNQTLTLGMFVPCDEDGNLLEKYKYFPCSLKYAKEINEYYYKYQKAKDKVLFEGFEICNRTSNIDCVVCKEDHISLKLLKGKTVEYLINRDITLTPNAIKQLKL